MAIWPNTFSFNDERVVIKSHAGQNFSLSLCGPNSITTIMDKSFETIILAKLTLSNKQQNFVFE